MIGLPTHLNRDILLAVSWRQGMTPRNAVRAIAIGLGHLPDEIVLDDHALDFVLWEKTAFPICDLEHALRQAHDFLFHWRPE